MMNPAYSLSKIASVTGGKLISEEKGGNLIIDLLIDSRLLIHPESTLFVCLVSSRNDGHRYIAELYEAGVRNFLVQKVPDQSETPDAAFILTDDTLAALQKLGAWHRSQFHIPVIGITGSNGKTIVKEWLYQLMSRDKKIIRSPKSYNSQIGVPLSVWKMESGHEMAIFEAGISRPGEMQNLEAIIRPTLGIFTNIGHAHDADFTDISQKVAEKMLLFTHADQLIYCLDHQLIHQAVSGLPNSVQRITWSRENEADLRILHVDTDLHLTRITGRYKHAEQTITIPFTDEAGIENAIHCWLMMLTLGNQPEVIASRMEALMPIAMRLELKEAIHQCSLINDSYNSDINSLGIALDFLNQQKQHQKKTVILSDILQSGRKKEDLYHEIADILQAKGIDRLIGIGADIRSEQEKFRMEKVFYDTTDDFLLRFPLSSFQEETILLKGARPFEFEKISHALQQKVHETILEVNLDAMVHNLNYYRSKLNQGVKTMVMVKAFSYGSGSFEIANLLQFHRVDYLAVAYADEGVELRKSGISLPIMVMNPEEESFDLLLHYNLEPEIYNFRVLNMLQKAITASETGEPVMIHVKIDTGMHRLGFDPKEVELLIPLLKNNPDVQVRSVFSHLAASEDPLEDAFTENQINRLKTTGKQLKEGLGYDFLLHIHNSAGISRFGNDQMDMVRLGIGLYGIGFNEDEQHRLRNVSTLKSTISQIRFVKAGDTIGYNRKGLAQQDSFIAVIPIGYADGINRRLGNGKGKMFIQGYPVPVIGNICMDTCMVDLTEMISRKMKVSEGDEVIIFGENYPVKKLAEELGTIPYEVLTGISRRVKRIYFHE